MPLTLPASLLLAIADAFGTPTFVYDATHMAKQYAAFTAAFAQSDVRVFYACKALTNVHVLRHMRHLGACVDCSSSNEVHLALYSGFAPAQIVYTSNGVEFSELEEVQRLGVHINIDSLCNLICFAERFGAGTPVGIRIRPNILAGGNANISTGHAESKFGIPLLDLPQVQALCARTGLRIEALHLHTGSDIDDINVFMQGIEVLLGILPGFAHVRVLDLGSGFKVPYQTGDPATDLAALGARVAALFAVHRTPGGQPYQLWFEPGKYLVSEAGCLLTRAAVVQHNPSNALAGVNSGFNHLIRPMLYGAHHGITNLSNPTGPVQPHTITGNMCETDTFATARPLPQVRVGDVLAFANAGAYGFEMASQFNSRFRPAEVLVEQGTPRLVRQRETFEDLIRNQLV